MKYSIWQVCLGLFILSSVLGLMAIVGSGSLLYNFLVGRAIEERQVSLQLLADTIGSPSLSHQELTYVPGAIENFLSETARTPGIVFIRMMDSRTGEVLNASDQREVGARFENSPPFEQKIVERDGVFNDKPIKELSVKSSAEDNIWMGVSFEAVQRMITLVFILAGGAVSVLFLAVGGIFVFMSRKLIIKPLDALGYAFEKLKTGEYGSRLGEVAGLEMQKVFLAFNNLSTKLAEVKEREIKVSKSKSEFISIVAHQLRTPLSAMKWTLRLLLDGDLDPISEKQAKFLQRGYESNERMIRLISDLLDVTRIEEGRFGYALQEMDITKIIAKSAEEFEILAKKREIRLIISPPAQPPPMLFIDPARISLVVSNLLSNAINYTLPGGSVTVTVKSNPTEVEVAIQDTGVGIPQEQISKLFTKFFRASNVLRMQINGTGLGLFIAKNILLRHGGRIWGESEEGKGSTFRFTLPLAKTAIPESEKALEEFTASI